MSRKCQVLIGRHSHVMKFRFFTTTAATQNQSLACVLKDILLKLQSVKTYQSAMDKEINIILRSTMKSIERDVSSLEKRALYSILFLLSIFVDRQLTRLQHVESIANPYPLIENDGVSEVCKKSVT